jgi:hypothetical protein
MAAADEMPTHILLRAGQNLVKIEKWDQARDVILKFAKKRDLEATRRWINVACVLDDAPEGALDRLGTLNADGTLALPNIHISAKSPFHKLGLKPESVKPAPKTKEKQ